MNRNQPLSNDELHAIAPSIFAMQPYEKVSSRYAFIPTISVVEKMRQEGFQPFSATQGRTRIEGKSDFTRHQIRFRDVRNGDQSPLMNVGDIRIEIILTNGHDGTSAYKIDAGLFRCACSNQMCVADGQVSQVNVRHSGNIDGIIEASYSVVEEFPKVIEAVAGYSARHLTAPQQTAYADAAIALRYDGAAPIEAAQLLRPRRSADAKSTLWNTFNVVQEAIVGGGVRGRNAETGARRKTRPVTGIAENTRLNKALWTLTERMLQLTEA